MTIESQDPQDQSIDQPHPPEQLQVASDGLQPPADSAATVANVPPPPPSKVYDWRNSLVRVWVPTLVVALFIITFNVQAFVIPSASMEYTLLIGDHLLVDRVRDAPPAKYLGPLMPYRPLRHGDIVVFMSVTQPDLHLVKRVIGVPGDRIHLEDKVVFRNGVALNELQAVHAATPGCEAWMPYDKARDEWPVDGVEIEDGAWADKINQYIQGGDVVVPRGHYFVMGDNRDCSNDSRYWGFVPEANVIGRPSIVYWAYAGTEQDYDQSTMAERVKSFFTTLLRAPTHTRWKRTLLLPK